MIKKLSCLVLCAYLILWSCSAVAVSANNTQPDAYNRMLCMFDMEHFDEAMQIIENNGLMDGGRGYADTIKYYRYIKARAYIDSSKWQESSNLLQELADNGFSDSKAWLNYVNGRLLEQKGDYEQALESYHKAIAEWSNYEVVTLCDIRIASLGGLIETSRINSQYEEAWFIYRSALDDNSTKDMRQAMLLFKDLGNYSDAASMAEKCLSWINDATRVISVTLTASDTQTIRVQWTDSTTANKSDITYTVRCAPEGSALGTVIMNVKGSSVTIDELVPNTRYVITVSDSTRRTVSASDEIKTPKAAKAKAITAASTSLYAIDRQALYYNGLSIDELMQNSALWFSWQAKGTFVRTDLKSIDVQVGNLNQQTYVYAPSFTVSNHSNREASFTWVVKRKNGGVWKETDHDTLAPNASSLFALPLDRFFRAEFDMYDDWQEGALTIELYTDDMLVASGIWQSHYEGD